MKIFNPSKSSIFLTCIALLPLSESFTTGGYYERSNALLHNNNRAIVTKSIVNKGISSLSPSSTTTTAIYLAVDLPSPEDSAKALTEYMAKSHAEKLKAIKIVEDKSKAEIDDLKAQIEQLKAAAASPPANAVAGDTGEGSGTSSLSVEEDLAEKLAAYQTFISKYIVSSQEEKMKAVQAAQESTTSKFEIKLNTLRLEPSAPTSADPIAAVGKS